MFKYNKYRYIRISDEGKNILEQAAEINKTSLSNYIMLIILKQAVLDIKENEKIHLTGKSAKIMLDLLTNPPEPNDALKELLKW